MSNFRRVTIGVCVEPCVKAALQLWADADHRSLSRQIEFLVLRALYRRGIDPTDFYRGSIMPTAGEPYNLAEYLELAARRRVHRRHPDGSLDAPSGGSPKAPLVPADAEPAPPGDHPPPEPATG